MRFGASKNNNILRCGEVKHNKTIMLVVAQGFTSRYILRSRIFDTLKKSGCRIVILSPSSKEKYFKDEFDGDNVFHEHYHPDDYRDKNSRIYQYFTLARLYSFKAGLFNNFTNYWKNQYFDSRKNVSGGKKLVDLILRATINVLEKGPFFRSAFNLLERAITPSVHRVVFEKYRPDLVVTTSLGMLPYDRFIMQEARKYGAKLASLVLSWDNTTTKGIAGEKPDYVVAWTETMKEELINYHDIRKERIFVGGVVQYEEYFKEQNLYTKDDLYHELGLDSDKKTIFYCLESPTAYKWNPNVLEILSEAIVDGRISGEPQLLVRPHPIYYRLNNGCYVYEEDLKRLKEIENKYPFVKFDYPTVLSDSMSHDMPSDEVIKLGSCLKYADVVLSFFSSINIEASIFDTPIINVEIYHKKSLPNAVMANHTHNKRVLNTGGVYSAASNEELISGINDYILDPARDRDGRKRIFENETGPNKGKAASKIGDYLISQLESL